MTFLIRNTAILILVTGCNSFTVDSNLINFINFFKFERSLLEENFSKINSSFIAIEQGNNEAIFILTKIDNKEIYHWEGANEQSIMTFKGLIIGTKGLDSNYEVIESSLESMKSFPVESLSIRYNLTNPDLYGDFAEYSLLRKKRVNFNHYQEDIKATQFIYERRSAAIGWQSKDMYVFLDNGLPILTEQTLSPLQRSIRISFHYKY